MTPVKLAAFICISVFLSSCHSPTEVNAKKCISAALQQPELSNGVAAFNLERDIIHTASANLNGWWRNATRRRYAAASLTKPRVAHAIRVRLASEDSQLDTKAGQFLPEPHQSQISNLITLRHLLQHTSGLGLPDGKDALWSHGYPPPPQANCKAAIQAVLNYPTLFTPGHKSEYSNAGYCVLGEILLHNESEKIEPGLRDALETGLGGAGGWRGTINDLHKGLSETLPLAVLPPPNVTLPDGSWYSFGWRFWPDQQSGAPWTHTGRLPGFLAVALTDGRQRLLVARFDGDPVDYHVSAARFGREAWRCLERGLE